MPKAKEIQKDTVHRSLIYGPPKSGKSRLAGTLAEDMELIWFDLERGSEVLYNLPSAWLDNITIINVPDTRDYPIAVETCLKAIRGGDCYICYEHGKVMCPKCMDVKDRKNPKPYPGAVVDKVNLSELKPNKCVVFDSLTQLTNSAISSITRKKADDYKLTYDDWAQLGRILDTFLGFVQVAPFNVVCISHENMVDMQDGKEKIVPVAGTRNFSRNSAKYFGEVIYCEVVNKKHVFGSATTYKNNVLTGSRTELDLIGDKQAKLLDVFKSRKDTQ